MVKSHLVCGSQVIRLLKIDPRQVPALRHRFVTDALVILFILGLTFKLSYDISKVRDLGMDDETYHLVSGYEMPRLGLVGAQNQPVYQLWYYLLSRLERNRIHLYYLNSSVLVFLVTASLYCLMRIFGGSCVLSLASVSLIMVSSLMEARPCAVFLASTVFLLGTIMAIKSKSLVRAEAILCVTMLIASYIRPEFAFAFIVSCAVALAHKLWVTLKHGRVSSLADLNFAAVVMLCVLFLAVFGNPLKGRRSLLAFGQHYARNVCLARALKIDSWTNWENIVRGDFGNAQSMPEAFWQNPAAFKWHVSENIRRTPPILMDLAIPQVDLPLHGRAQHVFHWFVLAVAVVGLLGLCLEILRRRHRRSNGNHLVFSCVVLSLILLQTILTTCLFFPRPHYFVPLVLLLWALLSAGFQVVISRCPWTSCFGCWPVLVIVMAGVLAIAPNRAHGWNLQQFLLPKASMSPILTVRATVDALDNLHIQSQIVILEPDFTRAFYANLNYKFIRPNEKHEGWLDFVSHKRISAVVLDERLCSDTRLRDDPEFMAFLGSMSKSGSFCFFSVLHYPVTLAVRSKLLSRPCHEYRE